MTFSAARPSPWGIPRIRRCWWIESGWSSRRRSRTTIDRRSNRAVRAINTPARRLEHEPRRSEHLLPSGGRDQRQQCQAQHHQCQPQQHGQSLRDENSHWATFKQFWMCRENLVRPSRTFPSKSQTIRRPRIRNIRRWRRPAIAKQSRSQVAYVNYSLITAPHS